MYNCMRWNPIRPWFLALGGDDQVVRVWELGGGGSRVAAVE